MADPFPTHDLVRIIYERGVQLLRSERGWLIPSSERLQHVENPGEVEGALDVRPIICDTQLNVPFFQPRRVIEATLPQVYELALLGQEPSRWSWLTGE